MKPSLRTGLWLVLLVACPCFAQTPAPDAAASTSPKQGKVCNVVRVAPTPGEVQIARKDYKAAEVTFRQDLTTNPANEDARLGLVRALIGQDRVADARAEAMRNAKTDSVLTEVALAEVAYRAAEVDDALNHSRAALKLDSCEARAVSTLAAILDLNGYYAKEASFLRQAHALRPNDELIRRDWIASLPRKQRQEELSKYLEGEHSLAPDEARSYDNELGHLKVRRAGECHVTSKADSTLLRLQPIYGDNQHPVAFGLDVDFNKTRRRMQIDTGASGILLTQSAARALKLTPEYHLKTGGVGDEGEVDSYLAHVQHIQIGDVEVSDCMVEVISKSKLDVDGLIGMDVFSHWLVTLNYGDAMARLDPLPKRPASTQANASLDDTGDDAVPQDRYMAPEMKDWFPVLRIGHNILLQSRFQKTSPLHFLIMDTGAQLTSLSTTMAKEAGKLHGSNMEFVGLSGKVNKVYETDTTQLITANIVIPPTGYYAYDTGSLSHNCGFEISGLLGLPTLQRLTIQIDYRDNLLKLSYDPKHDVIRF